MTSETGNPWEAFTGAGPWGDFDPTAIQQIDEKRGAPSRVRMSVGASSKPEDKLSTLKKYYPDATVWGDDNFVYTDPDTKTKVLFNPEGLDMGDVHENARMVAEFIGGSAAGTAAVIAGQAGPQVPRREPVPDP